MSSCCRRRSRPAPSATRTAISRRRAVALASSMLGDVRCTAISSRSETIAINASNGPSGRSRSTESPAPCRLQHRSSDSRSGRSGLLAGQAPRGAPERAPASRHALDRSSRPGRAVPPAEGAVGLPAEALGRLTRSGSIAEGTHTRGRKPGCSPENSRGATPMTVAVTRLRTIWLPITDGARCQRLIPIRPAPPPRPPDRRHRRGRRRVRSDVRSRVGHRAPERNRPPRLRRGSAPRCRRQRRT